MNYPGPGPGLGVGRFGYSGVPFCSDGGIAVHRIQKRGVLRLWTSPTATGGIEELFNVRTQTNARSRQVEDPLRNRQYFKQAVASDDYSFTAQTDGKYNYCFSNEGWTSNSKEVSFNVHGIVYVPEHEMAQDPLEVEGKRWGEQPLERNTIRIP
jgi:hypothetical protein